MMGHAFIQPKRIGECDLRRVDSKFKKMERQL